MTTSRPLTARSLLLATLACTAFGAQAATIRVQCEQRADRAKASVDAKNLVPGVYSTVIVSGGNMAAAPAQRSVGDELQTDYDSSAADIRAGAVAITPTFVVGAMLTGKVLDASGNTVIADTVSCRVRSR